MTVDISKITIPRHPGIYLMRDDNDTIIYVGKAKNLRNRVRSYFGKGTDYKTAKLVQKIASIEFVLTDNEGEAFILESNMIKQYRPKFNIELRDQQRYTYLRLSDEKYPRLLVARRNRDGTFAGRGKIFGPFTQGSSKLLTIGSLRKAFQIRICKTLPRKVCLEYHLGNCEGPCEFEDAQHNYAAHVADLADVLNDSDQTRAFAEKLAVRMHEASDTRDFERAMELRDTIRRLEGLQAGQKMESMTGSNEEYFGMSTRDGRAVVMTFQRINGVIRDSSRFSFDVMADNNFGNFLYQYYATRPVPPAIFVSTVPQNRKMLASMLAKKAGTDVQITVPRTGEPADLIRLIMKNVDLVHAHSGEPALADLKDYLGLRALPRTIECFDVSNHGESFAVGAMSRFVDGRPDRSGYRRFRIKTVRGRDDFAMMHEIIRRRYARLTRENAALPDLVLVDGGRGQLGSAGRALADLGLDIPHAALAKQDEEVFLPGRPDPVILSRTAESLGILRHARDEAHRFGVAYNHKIQQMKLGR